MKNDYIFKKNKMDIFTLLPTFQEKNKLKKCEKYIIRNINYNFEVFNTDSLTYIKYLRKILLQQKYFNLNVNRIFFNISLVYFSFDMIEMFSLHKKTFHPDIFILICKRDDIRILQWLKNNNCDFSVFSITNLIDNDISLDVCQYLYNMGFKWNMFAFNRAIHKGNLEMCKWLYSMGCKWDSTTFSQACKSFNKDLVTWLIEIGYEVTSKDIEYIPMINDFDFFRKFINDNTYLTFKMLNSAIEGKCFEICQWLIYRDCPKNEYSFSLAVKSGSLELCKMIYESNFHPVISTITKAVKINNIEICKWLYSLNYPIHDKAILYACENNNFEMCQWLYEKGCPWNDRALIHACNNNNFEMCQWLYEKGCPFVEFTLYECLYNENYEIFHLLYNNIDLDIMEIKELFILAININKVDICQLIYNKNFPKNIINEDEIYEAICLGFSYKTAKWLIDEKIITFNYNKFIKKIKDKVEEKDDENNSKSIEYYLSKFIETKFKEIKFRKWLEINKK